MNATIGGGSMLENARDFYLALALAIIAAPVLLLLSRREGMSPVWAVFGALGLLTILLITLVQWGGSNSWHAYPH